MTALTCLTDFRRDKLVTVPTWRLFFSVRVTDRRHTLLHRTHATIQQQRYFASLLSRLWVCWVYASQPCVTQNIQRDTKNSRVVWFVLAADAKVCTDGRRHALCIAANHKPSSIATVIAPYVCVCVCVCVCVRVRHYDYDHGSVYE